MAKRDQDLAGTAAAKMLSGAITRAADERGLSLRSLAKELGYKQAVVLSHMASGRVPIPIDRAEQLAEVLELNKARFLRAVVEQRHPEVNWAILSNVRSREPVDADPLGEELRAILGKPLRSLSGEQRRVMREVAAEIHTARRWISVHELPVLELIRTWRPEVEAKGLTSEDRVALKTALFEQLATRRG